MMQWDLHWKKWCLICGGHWCSAQDTFNEGLVAPGRGIDRDPSSISPFMDCFSCRAPPHARSHFFPGWSITWFHTYPLPLWENEPLALPERAQLRTYYQMASWWQYLGLVWVSGAVKLDHAVVPTCSLHLCHDGYSFKLPTVPVPGSQWQRLSSVNWLNPFVNVSVPLSWWMLSGGH